MVHQLEFILISPFRLKQSFKTKQKPHTCNNSKIIVFHFMMYMKCSISPYSSLSPEYCKNLGKKCTMVGVQNQYVNKLPYKKKHKKKPQKQISVASPTNSINPPPPPTSLSTTLPPSNSAITVYSMRNPPPLSTNSAITPPPPPSTNCQIWLHHKCMSFGSF